MKKILYILLFVFLVVSILYNYIDITESIKLSFNICFNNLFPTLIPFMLLSNIFIKYNFIEYICSTIGNIVSKLFKVNRYCSFAIILSIFTGTPSNAKYLKDLYNNNLIDNDDITKCIKFCHFTNPIFVLSTIGITFLNSKKVGIIILISHVLGSIILGVFNKKNIIIPNSKSINRNNSFIKVLNTSIIDTTNNLILILGVITFCLVLSTLINSILNINYDYKFIFGILEITQGLKHLSLSSFNILFKAIISTFLISFGGISIHMQVFSILDNKKIRYMPYLISRIIHGIISCLICFILLNIYKI